MIRSGLELGQITYGDLFRIIPFDNAVQVLKVTGAQLKLILQISQSGSRGYFPTSGLELKVIDPSRPAPTGDLDGDGKVAAWEVNRLAAVTLANGKPIEPTRTYRLATVDFLVGGGDDMGWIMKQIPREKIETANTGLVREVVESYFKELGTLNTAEMPAIHPTKPRIRFVSEPQGKARAKKSRRSKKKQSQTH
jgi:2',3'-cyclic-nucleotide 2'-phosphodiesterase (5'-nucleotidase family)